MTEADLCARGLHPRPVEGPCMKCQPSKKVCANGHDLTVEGATYKGRNDGRERCRQCRADRKARARKKAKDRKARLKREREYRAGLKERKDAEAQAEQEEADRREAALKPLSLPVPPAGVRSAYRIRPEAAGRYRLAAMIRRQRL